MPPILAAVGSPGCEQHADECCADRREEREPRECSAERRSTAGEDDVSGGRGTGHNHEGEFDREGCEIRARLVTDLGGEQVPNAGHDEDCECRPRNELEPTRDRPRGISATQLTHNRNYTSECDLPTDPHGRGEDVQEQSNGRRAYREHDSTLRPLAALEGAFSGRRT